MGFEIKEIKGIQFLNSKTNENMINTSVEFSQRQFGNSTKLPFDTPYVLEISDCQISKDILSNIANNTDYIQMDIPIIVQARKHKKKRINKKWLKRYGYKQIYKNVHAKIINIKADDVPTHGMQNLCLDIEFIDRK